MTQAAAFIAKMNEIWGDDPNNLYNDWNDANLVARASRATKLYAQKFAASGEYGYVYAFDDGSKAWVDTGGKGCYEIGTVRPERAPRRRKDERTKEVR